MSNLLPNCHFTTGPRVGLRAALLLAALAGGARAGNVLLVNTAADLPDAHVNDINCDAIDTTPGNQITLRAAVMFANAQPGEDTIIVPAGVWKLTLKGFGEDATLTGDLDVTDDLVITGTPADPLTGEPGTILDAGKAKDRFFDVATDVTLVLEGLTLRNGRAPEGESGGALRLAGAAELSQVIILGCHSPLNGGGIDVTPGTGSVALTDVLLKKNVAAADGGGLAVEGGQFSADGVTFQSCKAGARGGGVSIDGAFSDLTNVTFSSNSAKQDGGAVALFGGAVMSMRNSTLAGNGCKLTGGIAAEAGTNLFLLNSLLDNKGKRNFAGYLSSFGGNLDSGATCGFEDDGDISNVKPLLLKLKYYGGFTPTRALDSESPAIDRGMETMGTPAVDQRGVSRVNIPDVGSPSVACDVGAFEYTAP